MKKVEAKGLDEALGMDEKEKLSLYELLAQMDDGELSDADLVRQELRNNIKLAKIAVERAIEIQQEDEKPRNTEVISDLIKTINNCVGQLISLNKAEADIAVKKGKMPEGEGEGKHITNNILVANTSDIIEQITKAVKGEK